MKIENRKLSELKLYGGNPRIISDEAVDAVAASIGEFGFKVPILVDRDGVIVAGHVRHKAAQKLGLTEVPVIVADDLTPEQIKAYRIADNRTAELSNWDYELLPIELADLQSLDFDLELLGLWMSPSNAGKPSPVKKLSGFPHPRTQWPDRLREILNGFASFLKSPVGFLERAPS